MNVNGGQLSGDGRFYLADLPGYFLPFGRSFIREFNQLSCQLHGTHGQVIILITGRILLFEVPDEVLNPLSGISYAIFIGPVDLERIFPVSYGYFDGDLVHVKLVINQSQTPVDFTDILVNLQFQFAGILISTRNLSG